MGAPTLGAVGLGTSLVGGILSAFGAKRQGEANSKMYAYQAQVARYNAQIDKQNADYARYAGERSAANFGMKQAQTEATIRNNQAASGLDVNSGSAAQIQASARKVGQIDMATIRENAAKTAYDYEVKAVNDLNQAGLYDAASSNARSAGNLNMMASLISTAGSVSSKWMAGAQSGLWNGGGGGTASSGITLYGPDQNVVGYVA